MSTRTGKKARRTCGNRYAAKRIRRQGNPNQKRYRTRGSRAILSENVRHLSSAVSSLASIGSVHTAGGSIFPVTHAPNIAKENLDNSELRVKPLGRINNPED